MENILEFENRIKAFCRQKELFARGDRVLLGLSGGADSVCLFLVLKALEREWDLELVPVHVNHNLRGAEAVRDQQFCEKLCRQHNTELLVVSVQVEELAREQGWSLEEAGRNARYEAFAELAAKQNCSKTAVAHHMDDQAETVLFQLFRGSRLKGLSGMEAKNGSIIRPLLWVTRKEIEAYLKEKNQNFCIDSTNLAEEYTRNKVRHRIIPAARETCERAVEHIAETAEYAGQVEQLLERLTEELFARCAVIDGKNNISLQIDALGSAEQILADRVIYRALCLVCGGRKDITAGFVTDCRALMEKQTGRFINLPFGVVARKEFDILWIGREEKQPPERFYEEIREFPFRTEWSEDGEVLTLFLKKRQELEENIPKSTYTKWFDYDKIEHSIALRTPEAEDEIVLYADGRKKRMKDVFAEAKIPKDSRQKMRLLAEGNKVLWALGIRGSEAYHVTEATKYVLIATIDGGKRNGR